MTEQLTLFFTLESVLLQMINYMTVPMTAHPTRL